MASPTNMYAQLPCSIYAKLIKNKTKMSKNCVLFFFLASIYRQTMLRGHKTWPSLYLMASPLASVLASNH